MSTLGVSGVSHGLGHGNSFSLTPDDVGARVSVRRRVDGGVRDVVGDLESINPDADELSVRTPDGSVVVIDGGSVDAARLVGPSPKAARDLEAVSGRAWPAPDEAWLGKWWLRAAGGFTARANAARPLGDPGVPIDHALAYVGAWYSAREQPTTIRVVRGSSVDDELTAREWSMANETLIETTTVARLRRSLADRDVREPSRVSLAAAPSPEWLLRYRGGSISPIALDVLTGANDLVFASIEAADADGDTDVAATAIGRIAVEAPWAGFAAIEVDRRYRRQGYASDVMSSLLAEAAARGAIRVWLEVLASNEPALALYHSLGFTEHHRYVYRQPRVASRRTIVK